MAVLFDSRDIPFISCLKVYFLTSDVYREGFRRPVVKLDKIIIFANLFGRWRAFRVDFNEPWLNDVFFVTIL